MREGLLWLALQLGSPSARDMGRRLLISDYHDWQDFFAWLNHDPDAPAQEDDLEPQQDLFSLDNPQTAPAYFQSLVKRIPGAVFKWIDVE